MKSATGQRKHANRLANETSPYLLQHADNPVDWHPWRPEAFKRARDEDKPVFLSIGYSTCHWCHVMAHESFEDEHIASILNENFISIKVDREERPDVDGIYMNAVQVMTGAGGWPLSVFLTPGGEPFFAGTYFPPRDAFGRPSFEKVLLAIAQAWKDDREKLVESAQNIRTILADAAAGYEVAALSPQILNDAVSGLCRAYDSEYGGFGDAPKFPQPTTLSFLLRQWHRTKDNGTLEMVKNTLAAMADGGIYDHLGGGFHRYSTDAGWLVPHFEKMLYDQALLSKVYVEAYLVTGNKDCENIARQTFDYVLGEMTAEGGGFYSAEDADSEGREGWFYVWTADEIIGALGERKAAVFNKRYGVTAAGNFEESRNILHAAESVEQLAKEFNTPPAEIGRILAEGREILRQARSRRPRPPRDDKIVTASNAMMISSLAYAGAALDDPRYLDAASKSARFVLGSLRQDGRLLRSHRAGTSAGLGFLDDYAFMVAALFDLYQATFDTDWLAESKRLAGRMIDLFGEPGDGFYLTAGDAEILMVRDKPAYDGAVPSGNSAAAIALLKLGQLTMDDSLTDRASQFFDTFSGLLTQSPASLAAMLSAFDMAIGPARQIVVAGTRSDPDTRSMLRVIQAAYMPNASVILHEPGQAGKAIEQIIPFVAPQMPINGRATAYICENRVCKQPLQNAAQLKDMLSPGPGGSG